MNLFPLLPFPLSFIQIVFVPIGMESPNGRMLLAPITGYSSGLLAR